MTDSSNTPTDKSKKKTKRPSKGLRTHTRRLKQEARNGPSSNQPGPR